MLHKLKIGLYSAKEISEASKERPGRTIAYFLILVLLMAIPYVASVISSKQLNSNMVQAIQAGFKSAEVIKYDLTSTGMVAQEGAKSVYVDLPEYQMGILIAPEQDKTYEVKGKYIIIFGDAGIEITVSNFSSMRFKLFGYDKVTETLDMSLAKDSSNRAFWGSFLELFNDVLAENHTMIATVGSISLIISIGIFMLLFALFIALIIRMFDFQSGAKYREVLKIVISALLPFVLGVLLTFVFNNSFPNLIGGMYAMFLAMRAVNIYRNNKFKVNENE